MPVRRPRVLFLCHSAAPNGATHLLLDFLGWLQEQVDWELALVVDGGGPLLGALRRQVPVTRVRRDPAARLDALLQGRLPALRRGAIEAATRTALPPGRFDLVYANTSAVAPLVAALPPAQRRLLWHCHEMPYALAWTLRRPADVAAFCGATRYVAVSKPVVDALRSGFGIDADRIDLVPGFVADPILEPAERLRRRVALRARLGIPQDAFVVGGCGTLGWRKGTDLFLRIASMVAAAPAGADVRWLWTGGTPGSREWLEFDHDVRALGLGGRCTLVATTEQVIDSHCAIDALALSSREDPFPLVMLEAALQGVPLVCFERGGGAAAFADAGAGLVAPDLDLAAFGRLLLCLQQSPDLRRRLGERGRRLVAQRHRVETQGPTLLRSMVRCLGMSPTIARMEARPGGAAA